MAAVHETVMTTWRAQMHGYLQQAREDGDVTTATPDGAVIDGLLAALMGLQINALSSLPPLRSAGKRFSTNSSARWPRDISPRSGNYGRDILLRAGDGAAPAEHVPAMARLQFGSWAFHPAREGLPVRCPRWVLSGTAWTTR